MPASNTCIHIGGLTCRAAGLAVAQRAAEWVGPSVPSLVKHVLDRIGQEEQQSNQEELAGNRHLHKIVLDIGIRMSCLLSGLLKALAVAAVAYNAGREGQQKDDNWLSKLLTEPLLRTAARYVAAGQFHDHAPQFVAACHARSHSSAGIMQEYTSAATLLDILRLHSTSRHGSLTLPCHAQSYGRRFECCCMLQWSFQTACRQWLHDGACRAHCRSRVG